jgi:hypothetical protein
MTMKRGSWMAAVLGAAALMGLCPRAALADEGLSLRRVLLSSGGVGYFEYEARVQGDAALPLEVRLDQVDDVLKSLVVYDDQGGVGDITLPAKAPGEEAFRDLPFDASALTSEPALLDALRGAEVQVTTASASLGGRVLSVTEETTQLPGNAGTVTRHRLALATGGGVTTLILEDAVTVAFVDPALQAQLDAALASQLDQKERGRRTLTVRSTGSGDRLVRVAYVVAVPLWKSTYRLTLPESATPKTGALQGWAVVENQSGAAWDGVDLTLVSGNPVTFRQALYASYYVDRPEIPVEVVGRVLPRLEGGAMDVAEKAAPAAADHAAAWGAGGNVTYSAPMMPPGPATVVPADTGEAATQVVFHVSTPVTLASGEQGLIPIIARDVPAERVSLYQPDVVATNPLTSVELTNDGDTGLPPGVVTTYERSAQGVVTYVGDARLATLPAGERRLMSFGVDQQVRIDRDARSAERVTMARIAGGVLRLTRTQQRTTVYTIAGAAHEARTVILEQARLPGYVLVQPTGPGVEMAEGFYRIRVEVPAGATVVTKVVLSRPVTEAVIIANLSSDALGVYAAASELVPAVRDALAHVAALRAAVDEKEAAVKALEGELAQITTEQGRIRDNLKVVPAGSALYQRYLTELGAQEDRLTSLGAELDAARKAVATAKKALADGIAALRI